MINPPYQFLGFNGDFDHRDIVANYLNHCNDSYLHCVMGSVGRFDQCLQFCMRPVSASLVSCR